MAHRDLSRTARFLLAATLSFCTLAASAQGAPINRITNGDFSQTYQPVLSSNPLPADWTNLSGNTDNAGVWDGALRFSTMGVHNATTHRYYVYQSFDAGAGGAFTLSFDVLLSNAYNGVAVNGAKVAIDNWYVPAAQAAFSKTYGSEGIGPNAWHLGQTVSLVLTPGMHRLYLGTLGASQQNDRAYVAYDNVSITAAVPEPASALLMLSGSLALLLLSARRASGRC